MKWRSQENDIILFYRTKAENDWSSEAYKSVITGVGVVIKKF